MSDKRSKSRNSRDLNQRIELVLPELNAVSAAISGHRHFSALYPAYIAASHAIIRASVPLMQHALQRCESAGSHDPLARALCPYFEKHITEEADHDEWALADLEVLGIARDSVLARMPSPTVATLVGSQYYWIEHHHPVALLGYIAVLEGYPADPAKVEAFIERSGLPGQAFRTLCAHSRLDPNHRDDLHRVLDELPLACTHRSWIGLSAMHTVRSLTRVFEEVLESGLDEKRSRGQLGRLAACSGATMRNYEGDQECAGP